MLPDMPEVQEKFHEVAETLLYMHNRLEDSLYDISSAETVACCTYVKDDPHLMEKLKAYGAGYEYMLDLMEEILTAAHWFDAAWQHTIK